MCSFLAGPYDSRRLPRQEGHAQGESGEAAHFVKDLVEGAGQDAEDVAPGDRRIVYKDPQGEVHAVSARCTHLGCIVFVEPGQDELGLPLPRVALLGRRRGPPGAGGARPGEEAEAVVGRD